MQIAVLYGDPDKAEPFVFRLKFPAGYKVAAHIDPNDYDLTVRSGTMYLGIGDKFDPARGEGLKAGGYLHLPKGASLRVEQRGHRDPAERRRTGRNDLC